MWRIWWAANNTSKWQMGFNSAFKGLMVCRIWIAFLVDSLHKDSGREAYVSLVIFHKPCNCNESQTVSNRLHRHSHLTDQCDTQGASQTSHMAHAIWNTHMWKLLPPYVGNKLIEMETWELDMKNVLKEWKLPRTFHVCEVGNPFKW